MPREEIKEEEGEETINKKSARSYVDDLIGTFKEVNSGEAKVVE